MYKYFIINWQLYYFSVLSEQKINNQTQAKICLTISIYSRHNLLHFKTILNIYKNKIAVAKNMLILTINIFLLSIHHAKNICVLNTLLLYTNGVVSIPHSYLFFQIAVVILFIWRRRRSQYTLTIVCCVVAFFIGGHTQRNFTLSPTGANESRFLLSVCVWTLIILMSICMCVVTTLKTKFSFIKFTNNYWK